MKTKFDSLAQLKKQDLNKSEIAIIANNNLLASKLQALDTLLRELGEISVPKSGDFWDFKQINELKKTLVYEMDLLRNEIASIKQKAKKLQESYKIASIAYEKIKYLQETAIKQALRHLKITEIKNLDEISMMLFAPHKENA
ncbi:hypothetical protein BKH46_05285 [Helicobacter sp. 12S02634-8]|uniref:flagellar export protein FliJ n=1 Tax=Helicobacter sp. 12S02634-8 TaxID=1476199 RepID=UPI000BA70A13|nr:flagellar export protein FliJ [Helicobacter sp. 12S02634-8]PAF47124.1 hypothetical protein BKH46_05285 [Helicobacter sp. 12S02634-8]